MTTARRHLNAMSHKQVCLQICLLCSALPAQLMLLAGHISFPVLRVGWFWQEMLAGRFGLIGVQVRNSSLNLLVPQVSLQYGVGVQFPKMNGAGRKFSNLALSCGINTHMCNFGRRHTPPLLSKRAHSCQDPSCNVHLSPRRPFVWSSERSWVCRRRSRRTSTQSIGKDLPLV